MADRARIVETFVSIAGWADAPMTPLAGDASRRRYFRLRRPSGATAVLMDAPPDTGEELGPFLEIGELLIEHGFSAPLVIASDLSSGLLLLEDLGDALFARMIDRSPESEAGLYTAAADALAEIQKIAPPGKLARLDPMNMADLARIAFEWYAPAFEGCASVAAEPALSSLTEALDRHAPNPSVLALRDFHAENLVWLPDRDGAKRVGLLDFQDAVIAHPAYDLVSLLADARRDVSEPTRSATMRRFLDLTGHDETTFVAAAAAISVQRNMRILGVFARLALRDGKPAYLRLVPRVWGHLVRDLLHPDLAELRKALLTALPEPDPDALKRLEAQCATPAH